MNIPRQGNQKRAKISAVPPSTITRTAEKMMPASHFTKSSRSREIGRDVPVSSTRAGYIPGTHRLGFDSVADQITITHAARSREGFAAGALMAAEWIVGRKGFYEFSEVFDEIVKATI